METVFEKLLVDVEVMEPVSVNGFQVFGLKRSQQGRLEYLTLDEGLARGLVEVTEISVGGSVPTLSVSNKGEHLLFLMAGEQLQGAKQNRVLNVSIMVPSKSDLPIPVSCVESGRWAYTSRMFSSSGTASHSFLRAKMSRDVTESYRTTSSPASNQGEVWHEISRKLGKMGSQSSSNALNQVYEDYQSKLGKVTEDLKYPAGSSGAVFAFGGRIVGMDLFDQNATFEKLWPKLVRSYAIDAMEEAGDSLHLPRHTVEVWLKSALTANSERFRSPGLGDDVRFNSPSVVGSSLLLNDEAVHTELFGASTTPREY